MFWGCPLWVSDWSHSQASCCLGACQGCPAQSGQKTSCLPLSAPSTICKPLCVQFPQDQAFVGNRRTVLMKDLFLPSTELKRLTTKATHPMLESPQSRDPVCGSPRAEKAQQTPGMTSSSSFLADDDEHEWIIKTCRKGWDEIVGHRPKL